MSQEQIWCFSGGPDEDAVEVRSPCGVSPGVAMERGNARH